MFTRIVCACMAGGLLAPLCHGEATGFISEDGAAVFPIGFYELPQTDEGLKAMAEAGVNVAHCHSRADLDRVHAVGMMGVYPLPLQKGDTEALRAKVKEAAGHPALAIWEGPDEVVWNFTAYSGLFRKHKIHKVKGAWWKQTPEAVAYAEKKAAQIIPNMRAASAAIRELDDADRPIWINEAQKSDTYYVRQCLDFIDVTGCDIYPVNERSRDIERLSHTVQRWNEVGRGMPVYMVLQAFSWHELGDYYGAKTPAYPSFAESRFMAYTSIAQGARGIHYWGSRYLKSEPVRESIYALTSELAALQPFLTAPEVAGPRASAVEMPDKKPVNVSMACRRAGDDWLIILVNEDPVSHMGVVVEGLGALDGRRLHLLYEPGQAIVSHGELIARMQPYAVHVYATSREWEAPRRDGRDYAGEPAQ